MHWLLALDYHHWLLAGLFLLILELILGKSLLLWVGLAALATGLFVLLLPLVGVHLAWPEQLLTFGLSLVVVFILRLMLSAFFTEDAPLPGEEHLLAAPIRYNRGYIVINNRRWPVTGPDLPAGARVRVRSRAILTLDVEPVE